MNTPGQVSTHGVDIPCCRVLCAGGRTVVQLRAAQPIIEVHPDHVLVGAGEPFSILFEHEVRQATKRTAIRFAVGTPGKRSTIWRVWSGKETGAVYVASRHSAGELKLSLHESGDWRIQQTRTPPKNGQPTVHVMDRPSESNTRVIQSWTRPEEIASGWTFALGIGVPANHLIGLPTDQEKWEDAQWIAAPKLGRAAEIHVYLVRPNQGLFRLEPEEPDDTFALINCFELATGEVVIVMSSSFTMPDSLAEMLTTVTNDSARQARQQGFNLDPELAPRHMALDDDSPTPWIWDLTVIPIDD